ncbi:hypothetical protein [Aminobacter phage Erebus]|nr:hypothetical protein [Aminobacter phage Erebus]
MAGIRIDALPTTVLPTLEHAFPAMKDGLSVKLSLQQVLEVLLAAGLIDADSIQTLANKTLTAPLINNPMVRGGAAPLTVQYSDDGASIGPILILDRVSATPAASDVIPGIYFRGRDSAGNTADYFRMMGRILDATDGSEDGQLVLQALINGVTTGVCNIGAGVQLGGATGGDPGVGKLNAVEVQQQGVPLRAKGYGTAVAATGSAIDFVGIPSWARKIIVLFDGVSLSGTDSLLVQAGAGAIETTGYASCSTVSSSATTSTAGFIMRSALGTKQNSGRMTLESMVNVNRWVSSHSIGDALGPASAAGGGNKVFGGAIDRVRITGTGSDTLDAGVLQVSWEG